MRNDKVVLSGNINKVCQTTKTMLELAKRNGIKTMYDFLQNTGCCIVTKLLIDDFARECFMKGYNDYSNNKLKYVGV